MSGAVERRIQVQYGVRYGDGEVEGPFSNFRDASDWRKRARASIESGEWKPDDYEPMILVRREHRLTITPWTEGGLIAPATAALDPGVGEGREVRGE